MNDRITNVSLVTNRPTPSELKATIQHCFDAFIENVKKFQRLPGLQQLIDTDVGSAAFTLADPETGLKFRCSMALAYEEDDE